MKFSTALALSTAPLAMAKAVHNAYPVKRDLILASRKSDDPKQQTEQKNEKQSKGQQLNGQQNALLAAELAALGLPGLNTNAAAGQPVIVIWVNQGAGAPTINVNQPAAVAPAVAPAVAAPPAAAVTPGSAAAVTPPTPAAAPAAAGATHNVIVGGNAGLIFAPAELKAAVGDMVVFTFMAANHTVTQSTFETPCVAMAGGMDSGFIANVNNTVIPPPQVAMQVMVDTPLWFYCKQKGHCGKGMTFSINPSAAKTQAMFQALAIAQNGTGSGSAITGGAAANGTAPAVAPAVAPAAAPAAAAGGLVTQGTGTLAAGGQCVCAVICTAGSVPAVNAQGVGSFGGLTGALPMQMSEPAMNAI